MNLIHHRTCCHFRPSSWDCQSIANSSVAWHNKQIIHHLNANVYVETWLMASSVLAMESPKHLLPPNRRNVILESAHISTFRGVFLVSETKGGW